MGPLPEKENVGFLLLSSSLYPTHLSDTEMGSNALGFQFGWSTMAQWPEISIS